MMAFMAARDVESIEKLHPPIVALAAVVQELDAHELAAAVPEVQRCVNTLAEVQRRLAANVHRSDVWALDGYRSPSRWIAQHSCTTVAAARRLHATAVSMHELPHAAAAALDGGLHEVHVREIVRCQRRAPDRFDGEMDLTFTQLALAGDLDAFAVAVRAWHEQADAHESPDPADLPIEAERESFRLDQGFDGWWHGEFRLSPADGAQLNAVIERGIGRYLNARRDGDPSQEPMDLSAMRAQILMDLLDLATRHDPTRASAPDRYHVALTLQADEDGHIQPAESCPPGATCDTTFHRMVIGARGEALDIGRATRDWPGPMRAAIIHRDRRCRWRGCHEPPGHCDVHHCTPWESGGETAVSNGVLLCRWHHTFLHSKGWTVQLDAHQQPIFRRPDGTIRSTAPDAPMHDTAPARSTPALTSHRSPLRSAACVFPSDGPLELAQPASVRPQHPIGLSQDVQLG
jgi:hypothetical protein